MSDDNKNLEREENVANTAASVNKSNETNMKISNNSSSKNKYNNECRANNSIRRRLKWEQKR